MIFIFVLLLIVLAGIVCLISLSKPKSKGEMSADDFEIVEIK
ncbi:MAG: hypothetical protein QG585_338 [Patescibacteria group bacterium]|jgi:hypothetical protein|nr:hypothetical protein [Patescibacteria group bacterium]